MLLFMMTMIKRSFFLVFLFAFISFGAVRAYGFLSFGEDKYELVNHKAIYDFELIRLKKASQLADIKGVMNFSWEKDCEGWSTSQNYKMNYYYAGGQKIFLETELASWESKEGDLYRFFVKNNKNNLKTEIIEGEAFKNDKGEFEFSYSQPEDHSLEPVSDIYFPNIHSTKVWELIKSGKRFFSHGFFDGSDLGGAALSSVFILNDVPKDKVLSGIKGKENIDQELLDVKAKKIRLSFFPPYPDVKKKGDVLSTYEMDIIFLSNGVVSEMLIDYHDYIVKATLKELKPLDSEPQNCF